MKRTRTISRGRRRCRAAVALASALAVTAAARAQHIDAFKTDDSRVLHTFDFDERDDGNLEDLPMFWQQLRPRGFPHFTHARFDFSTGHNAAPSFLLESEGRNVAFQYLGSETPARASTVYRVRGYVKPKDLLHARAALSVVYLDHQHQPLPRTLVRSRWLGGPLERDWQRVELIVQPPPPEARWIGIMAWVVQEDVWNIAVPPRRHIRHLDVEGGAWFDDISVATLPHAELRTTSPANVLVDGEDASLLVMLADYDDSSLVGHVTIRAADGEQVASHSVPVSVGTAASFKPISLDELEPGLYDARMDVISKDSVIFSESLRFAKVVPLMGSDETRGRSFGVTVSPENQSLVHTEFELITNLAVGVAKLPLWTGLPFVPPAIDQSENRERHYQLLTRHGVALTGVLYGPPTEIVRAAGAYQRRLIELLAGDVDAWQAHMATILAASAGVFRSWQIGPDGTMPAPVSPEKTQRAADQLRSAMKRYLTTPTLAMPVNAHLIQTDDAYPVEQVTVSLPGDVPPSMYEELLAEQRKRGHQRVSAYVEPLESLGFDRIARLADFARRSVLARFRGADTVFSPQPWRVRPTARDWVAEPLEEYLVTRTLADLLGATTPAAELQLADGVTALTFSAGDSMVFVLWDDQAPAGGRHHALQLGSAEFAVDLWGRRIPLQRDEAGRHILTLDRTPILIPGVDRWIVDLRTAIAIEPTRIDTGLEAPRFAMKIDYKGPKPVAGRIELTPPEGWELLPSGFNFSAIPHREKTFAIEAGFPHSEPAGVKQLTASLELLDTGYVLEIPLRIELGLPDIEARGHAVAVGNDLFIRHSITNTGDSTLSFRGSASVPGAERQYRPFTNVAPGQTQSVEYRFAGAANLVGRKVYLSLREMNDGPRIHTLELIVP